MRAELEPYVGPRPFERDDRALFFGRDREARDLLSLVVANAVVLLYAQSGVGKTSLINARLIPVLEEEKAFDVLPVVRMRGPLLKGDGREGIASGAVPNLYAFYALAAWSAANGADGHEVGGLSLASYLAQRDRPMDETGEPVPRVAIFDQFEELFILYPERWKDREGFFEQLAEALDVDPLLRILLAMREDYVARLETFASLLPDGLRTRLHLEGLRKEAAVSAITGPVVHTGRSFAAGAAETLVEKLLKVRAQNAAGEVEEAEGEFVEPVQLQVVCRSLWRTLPPAVTLIGLDEVGRVRDVDAPLADYYAESVKAVAERTGTSERVVRDWFSRLIDAQGVREQVAQGVGSSQGLSNPVISALVDMHLVRREERRGFVWLELAHDRLVRPVQENNAAWSRSNLNALQLQADLWDKGDRESRLLLRDRALREAERWARVQELLPHERAFLDECRKAQHSGRVRTVSLFVAIGALFCAISIVIVALSQSAQQRALFQQQQRLADQQARLASLREMAAVAIGYLNVDPERSVILARQAVAGGVKVGTLEPEVADALYRSIEESKLRQTLRGHTDGVNSSAFSRDGTRLATASWDWTTKLWDAQTGEEIRTLVGHSDGVTSVAFSPDGGLLATGSADKTARIWDVASGTELRSLEGHEHVVTSVAFSPDGAQLATGSDDWRVIVWDVASGRRLRTLLHDGAVTHVAFSPNGKRLASASRDLTAKVWDADTGAELFTLSGPSGHKEQLTHVTFSPDGRRIATASWDSTAKVWDADTHQNSLTFHNHNGPVTGVAFSSDGTLLATSSNDGSAKVWAAATGREFFTLYGHSGTVNGIVFSPAGDRLATASGDWTTRLWEVPIHHADRVNSALFSPDGALLATASADGTANVWDARSGRRLNVLDAHQRAVASLAFNADGRRLATASVDGTAKVWEIPSGRELFTLKDKGDAMYGVAFSPDGTRLATAGSDQMVRLWDEASGDQIGTLPGHSDWVYMVTFSPDGTKLASASADGTARIWDVASGAPLSVLPHGQAASVHPFEVYGVAFSPDGMRLATAGQDSLARIWDLATGRELLRLYGHVSPVNAVTFSGDGTRLATASSDKTAKVWDTPSGATLQTLSGQSGGLTSVAFSPDGIRLATAGSDAIVHIYALSPDEALTLAKQRVTRSLTLDECQRILKLDECPPA